MIQSFWNGGREVWISDSKYLTELHGFFLKILFLYHTHLILRSLQDFRVDSLASGATLLTTKFIRCLHYDRFGKSKLERKKNLTCSIL